MANKPTKEQYEGFKKAVANPMTPAPLKASLQGIIDKYSSEYEGGATGTSAEEKPKATRGRKPVTAKKYKTLPKPKVRAMITSTKQAVEEMKAKLKKLGYDPEEVDNLSGNEAYAILQEVEGKMTTRKPATRKPATTKTKQTATDIAKAKAEIKAKTGKTEAECESIIEQYRALRTKAQEGKRKAEKANTDNKERVSKLQRKGNIIEGTNEKTADAVIESTAKDVAEKIEKQVEAVEAKAETEAKAEVAKDKTITTPKAKKEAIQAKVEKKVAEKTKTIVKRVVIDTSALLTSIATSLGKFDKDSQKEFLIKLRSDIDKLLAKYAFGGMTDGATQVMNVQQSNLSASSVNPTLFAGGGGVDREIIKSKTFLVKKASSYQATIVSLVSEINRYLTDINMPKITTKEEFDMDDMERIYVDNDTIIRVWDMKDKPNSKSVEFRVSVFTENSSQMEDGGGVKTADTKKIIESISEIRYDSLPPVNERNMSQRAYEKILLDATKEAIKDLYRNEYYDLHDIQKATKEAGGVYNKAFVELYGEKLTYANGGGVGERKVFVAQEDGIIGVYSGAEAYSIQIQKGDKFETFGNQDKDINWWFVKKIDKTPMKMYEDSWDYKNPNKVVNVDWDKNLLTFPKDVKGIYAEMKEVYAGGGGVSSYGKGGGVFGEDAKLEYVDDAFASDELKEELMEKLGIETNSLGDNVVISFAYTDYGGDFLDKVAIRYFEENYPENTLVENAGYNGQNAYVFGEPAQEWIDTTDDYPLGFENIEDLYYEMTNEAEYESYEYFLDDLERDDYVFEKDDVMNWLMENKGGYYSMTTTGLDFSYSDLEDELVQEGLISKEDEDEDEDEYGHGGGIKDVIVYDNNGETFDRYTIFTPDGSVYGMSDNALMPNGFNMYIGDNTEVEKGSHLGKKLKSVPESIKIAVQRRMSEEYARGGKLWIDTKTKGGLKGVKPSRKNTFAKQAQKRGLTSGQLASKVLANPSRYQGINPKSAQLVNNMGVRRQGGSIDDIIRSRRGQ